jgi:glutaredoxin 3
MAREAGIIDFRDAYSEEHVQTVLEDLKAFEALVRADERALAAPVQEPVACGACNGSGWIVRDPDIGTDQKCFDCDNPYEFDGLREKYPEVKQLPQIFINNQRVGGLAGLQNALKELGL